MTYYKELGKKLSKVIEEKVEVLKAETPDKVPPEHLNTIYECAEAILEILNSISNIDNTADMDKPVSTAQQTALDAKVPNTRTVNGKALSENITLKASDIGADASGTAANQITSHNISTTAHNDIRLLITGLTNRLNALANSDDTTLDQMKEVVAYIKDNRALIESVTTNKVNVSDIINNLTTNVSNQPLSAAQGVIIKGLIDALENIIENHMDNITVHVTSTERTNWDDAYALKHEHSNISVLNKITQTLLDAWNNAVTHISDTIKHITSDERTLWNTVSNKVDKVSGKGLSTNDFTDTDKSKLDGIATGANKTIVDSALSSTSTNPVQNKVINSALAGKANTSHGNHVPTTETANNAKFLRNDNTWATVTPANIGAATTSHGTHVPAACSTITDWNNATTNGWYMGLKASNAPDTTNWYMGYVVAHNTNYVYQEVYQFTASTDAKVVPKYIRTKMNGTWGSWTNVTVAKAVPSNAVFTDNNTVYTHPTTSGNKHIPSGGSSGQILRWSADGTAVWGNDNNTTYGVVSTTADGLAPKRDGSTTKYLRADGTWATPPDNNTTYNNMTAATSSAAGKAGLVPAPAAGAQAKFLRGDGTWQTPTNTTYSNFVKSGSGAKAGLVPAPSTTAGTTKYLREDGTWQVPPDTKTDTKNTTGTTNKVDTKLFLAGATSQAANPATYSNINVYIGEDNCLYSNGKKVVHEVTITTDSDFDTFTETGIYHIAFTGGSNRPSTNHGTLYVDTEVGTDYQLFIPDSVHTVTYKRSYDNTNKAWKAWTTQKLTDTNTTYSNMTAATSSAAGKAGLVPAPAAGAQAKFLRGDGTWQTPTNTTYSNFVKSGSGAKAGLVPAPSTTAGTTKYLREDGTWQTPNDTKATQTNTTTNADYRVVLSTNANDTTETNTLRKSGHFKANPATGAFFATGYDRNDITGQTKDLNDITLFHGNCQIVKFICKTSVGSSNIANIPVASSPFILDVELIRWASTTDFITKQTFSSAGDMHKEYVRYCKNGIWDASWTKRLYTDTNTTYSAMTGASSSAAGKAGLVPAPAAGAQGKFLRGDGTWQTPTNTVNTAGSTNTSSKIFLVGATSQAANPQTYSHDTAYVGTDGHVYSNSKQTVNLSDKQALTNKTYNGYTLAAACAKAVTDSSSASAISTGTSLVTERDVYYGLPTINNSHAYTSRTSIYAPTGGGTSGYLLQANGSTSTPTWSSISTLKLMQYSTTIVATGSTATILTISTTPTDAGVLYLLVCENRADVVKFPVWLLNGKFYIPGKTTAYSTIDADEISTLCGISSSGASQKLTSTGSTNAYTIKLTNGDTNAATTVNIYKFV